MKRKLLFIISAFFLILLAVGLILIALGLDVDKVTWGYTQLEPFNRIEVNVGSPDVKIIQNEDYGISYSLHGREKIKQFEVKNGTLYFKTGFDFKWKPIFSERSVVISVPETTILEDIIIDTKAGDIVINEREFSSGNFKTKTGVILLDNVNCNGLNLETVTDKISVTNSQVSEMVKAESVLGKIELAIPSNGIIAESYGGIIYNEVKQGRHLNFEGSFPSLSVKSVLGKIIIENPIEK